MSHLNDNPAVLSLKFANKLPFNLTSCLQLIKIYSKCRSKLPSFIGLALTDKSYQQSTSEKVANFKAQQYSGDLLIDASGGLGVDDHAFAKSFAKVISYDTDTDLNDLVRYNFKELGITNVERLDGSLPLNNMAFGDVLYLDPDRRPNGKRLIGLSAMEPNVLKVLEKVPSKTKVLIKLSPVFEVKQLLAELSGVQKIFAISEGNDVKELLVELVKDAAHSYCELHAVEVGYNHYHYTDTPNAWTTKLALTNKVLAYLYLPKASINKLHLAQSINQLSDMVQLDGFELFTSKDLIERNELRAYEVLCISELSIKKLKRSIKEWGLKTAEIIVKGHKEHSELWYKKLNVNPGSNKVLFLLFGKVSKAILCETTN